MEANCCFISPGSTFEAEPVVVVASLGHRSALPACAPCTPAATRDPSAMAYAIQRSCENKAAVVAADEKEGGVRATLNLGHTFGHVR